MKILMIAPQFIPLVGGYERACQRLAESLVGRGHHVTVAAERRDKKWKRSEMVNGVSINRWWCVYKTKRHIITSVIGLILFLIKQGRCFDVWHIHQYGIHAAAVVVFSKIFGKPVVLKLTSSSDAGLASALKASRFEKVLIALHLQVDAVVALTKEMQIEAEKIGFPKAKVHVIGNGVDSELFHPVTFDEKTKLKIRLGIDKKIVLFVGRLSHEKNVEGLLNAWRSAKANLEDDWILVLIGDGPLRAEVELLAQKMGVDDATKFLGHVSSVDLWMRASEIYVSTSLYEGLSNSMLEAMAVGLPVVTTRVSGVSEIIEESFAGFAVSVGDMDGIAACITTLAKDGALSQKFGCFGREKVVRSCSLVAVSSLYEQMYFAVDK